MVLSVFIARGIDQAKAGMSPEQQEQVSAFEMEAETLTHPALHQLAEATAKDARRRHSLSKAFSLTLVNDPTSNAQYAVLDDAMLTSSLGRGSVRVTDGFNSNLGTELHRVLNYSDFISYQSPIFGYYCLHDGRIYVKSIASPSFADALGPLVVECPFVPLVTEIPAELEDDAVAMLAALIRTGAMGTSA